VYVHAPGSKAPSFRQDLGQLENEPIVEEPFGTFQWMYNLNHVWSVSFAGVHISIWEIGHLSM